MLKASYITVEYLKNNTGKLTSEQKGTAMSVVGTTTHPLKPIHVDWNQTTLDKFFNGPIGYSPHEFEGGIRNKKNYLRTHFVLIDIDNGMPADDFIKVLEGHPYHPQYYINFSANSQPECEKYHVIMPLDVPIDGISQHRLLANWLLHEFGQYKPDLSVINDCARGVLRGNAAFPSRMGGRFPLPTKAIVDSQRQQKTIEHLQKQGSVIDGKEMYVSLLAVQLEASGRCFSVCPRQEVPLRSCDRLPKGGHPTLVPLIHVELIDFLCHFHNRKYAFYVLFKPIENAVKACLEELMTTYNDEFFAHTKPGAIDWEWLELHISNDYKPDSLPGHAVAILAKYLTNSCPTPAQKIISWADYRAIYANITGKTITPQKFSRLLTLHNLSKTRLTVNGIRDYYIVSAQAD
jgi:hypothetical protein